MKLAKQKLREEALGKRDEMDVDQRARISRSMAIFADDIIEDPEGLIIAGFWPIRSEIDPVPLMTAFQDRGAHLALPALVSGNGMVFRRFSHVDDLVPMGFGTMGPSEKCPIVLPDLLLMPLAVFDNDGHRIGYGGGFYDRAIAAMHQKGHYPLRLGLAFDCQHADSVPVEPHDFSLQGILTQSGLRWLDKELKTPL